jgi:hypothetical protein
MNPGGHHLTSGKIALRLWLALACATVSIHPAARARQRAAPDDPQSPSDRPFTSASKAAPPPAAAIILPSGTVLPVRLNASVSSAKNKVRQIVTGRIMQDIPLPDGSKIREGAVVEGHIVEVIRGDRATGARVSIQFDTLRSSRQAIPISTSLRAIAGPMEVAQAQTPRSGPGESDVFDWSDTVQIGGDAVYGLGGPVTAANDSSLVVGKRVASGVLSQVRAKEGTKCRGAIDGNQSPQALWVFSSDACGTYGIEHLHIAHAGRTVPVGVIVLSFDSGTLKIRSGTAMLLRVGTAK